MKIEYGFQANHSGYWWDTAISLHFSKDYEFQLRTDEHTNADKKKSSAIKFHEQGVLELRRVRAGDAMDPERYYSDESLRKIWNYNKETDLEIRHYLGRLAQTESLKEIFALSLPVLSLPGIETIRVNIYMNGLEWHPSGRFIIAIKKSGMASLMITVETLEGDDLVLNERTLELYQCLNPKQLWNFSESLPDYYSKGYEKSVFLPMVLLSEKDQHATHFIENYYLDNEILMKIADFLSELQNEYFNKKTLKIDDKFANGFYKNISLDDSPKTVTDLMKDVFLFYSFYGIGLKMNNEEQQDEELLLIGAIKGPSRIRSPIRNGNETIRQLFELMENDLPITKQDSNKDVIEPEYFQYSGTLFNYWFIFWESVGEKGLTFFKKRKKIHEIEIVLKTISYFKRKYCIKVLAKLLKYEKLPDSIFEIIRKKNLTEIIPSLLSILDCALKNKVSISNRLNYYNEWPAPEELTPFSLVLGILKDLMSKKQFENLMLYLYTGNQEADRIAGVKAPYFSNQHIQNIANKIDVKHQYSSDSWEEFEWCMRHAEETLSLIDKESKAYEVANKEMKSLKETPGIKDMLKKLFKRYQL